MILIDSSVWIDFFNGIEGKAVSELEKLIVDEEDICLSEYILTEVLQGFRDDSDYETAKRYLLRFPVAGMQDENSYVEAAQIYRKCRNQGITIRKAADCIVAQNAIENNLFLLHKDQDFNMIASVCSLKVYTI
jgi:hypothetical protein